MPTFSAAGWEFTTFHPKFLTPNRVRAYVLNASMKRAKLMKADLDALVAGWKHKVDFEVTVRYRAGNAVATVFTDDAIFGYLDKGTSIRWAKMSNNFTPKTSNRSLRSGSGSGRVTARGRGFMIRHGIPPQKGIEAREFMIALMEKHEQAFFQDIQKAIFTGVLP